MVWGGGALNRLPFINSCTTDIDITMEYLAERYCVNK